MFKMNDAGGAEIPKRCTDGKLFTLLFRYIPLCERFVEPFANYVFGTRVVTTQTTD